MRCHVEVSVDVQDGYVVVGREVKGVFLKDVLFVLDDMDENVEGDKECWDF